jgi:transcriptional regulator with XRE-family HTH domain
MSQLTELGVELRNIRRSMSESMSDMANRIGISESYISSIETGKRRTPSNFVSTLASIYDFDNETVQRLSCAEAHSIDSIKIDISECDKEKRELATLVAKSLNNLSSEQCTEMTKILNNGAYINEDIN